MLITYPRDGIRRLRSALLHSYAGFINEAKAGTVIASPHARQANRSDRMPTTQTPSMT